MPLYTFKNKITGEMKDVFQMMNEEHFYEEGGKKWDRVFTVPQASIDTRVDPNDKNKFLEKTSGRNQTVGDLWDRSAELSRARAARSDDGFDPLKKKAVEKMKEVRRGKGGDRGLSQDGN